MLDKLFFTCNAVFPIILTILVGYVLKILKVFPEDFFKLLNKLSFKCSLPVLLFYNVYNVDKLSDIANYGKVCAFSFIAIMTAFLIPAVVFAFAIKDKRQKGVMVQAAYRSNNAIIGLSLVTTLVNGEKNAIAVVSILSSLFIPLFNILAVISLTMYMNEDGKKIDFKAMIKKILTNPLIIGCGIGFVCLIARYFIPVKVNSAGNEVPLFTIKENLPFVFSTVTMIANCATPIALIALGGTFTFSAIAKLKKLIVTGTFLRVFLVPVVVLVCAYFFGFKEVEFPALIALFATPTAVSSVPMASEMNNDDELAGQLVVWSSIMSAFTLFGIIFACTQIGIFKV